MTWLAWFVEVAALLVAMVCWEMWRREHMDHQKDLGLLNQSQKTRSSEAVLAVQIISSVQNRVREPRYLIQMSDWGPEFTGEDGSLHRWRWVIYDAHAGLRAVAENKPSPPEDFVMLGNSETAEKAWNDAEAWCERYSMKLVKE